LQPIATTAGDRRLTPRRYVFKLERMAWKPALVGAIVYGFGIGTGLDHHAPLVVAVGLVYWLVNTAILGAMFTVVTRHRGDARRARLA
jgi:hypothetical protein